MSRFTDISMRTLALTEPSQLPAINWSAVGQQAPKKVSFTYSGPNADPPKADAIVITWTSAEWAAMDHVFLRNATSESPSGAEPSVSSWFLYSKNATPGGSSTNKLWGYYQLISIQTTSGETRTILLFKSDAHLAHPPYLTGLAEEIKLLIQAVQPQRVYSIGTAGGATDQQNLGDVAITNAGTCKLTLSENSGSADNNKTFTCTTYFPNTTNLLPKVQNSLFYKLSEVATMDEWNRLLTSAKNDSRSKSLRPYSLDDLLNGPINPANLSAPKAVAFKDIPLLTTDTYFIAQGNSPQYAVLEMDDTIIAAVCDSLGTPFSFVRNVSDGVIASTDQKGQPIDPEAREAWSSVEYDHFGVYSSFNGALAAWAVLTDW